MDKITLDKDIIGLTSEEVKRRVASGKVNILPDAPSRTVWQIVRANLFTIFNALNIVLASIVFLAGSPKNALFSGVIITNTVVGIVQELRAKKKIESLSLLSSAKATVIRDGKETQVGIEEVVVDDIIVLSAGDQLIVDAVVLEDTQFEVDESLLTGESDSVNKKLGSKLLSGSFVTSGSGLAKVTHVGNDTYTAKLSQEAKKFKLINSELQQSINKIVKIIIWLIIPVGVLLMSTQILCSGKDWQEAALSAVAGIIGMVPEGLVLLTSVTFVVGIIRLSKWKTLVQELPATEVLARVDMLCLDKTGTITEGKLNVVDFIPLNSDGRDKIEEEISALTHAFQRGNPTQDALLEKYKENPNYEIIKKIPFSSARKWSAVSFKGKGSFIIGAPDMILNERYEEIKTEVEEEAKKGRRVILVAKSDEILEDKLPGNLKLVALILIEDVIRKEAPKTLKYFDEQGVNIKIISGDSPITVSAVAKRAGVKGAENYLDARELSSDEKDFSDMIEKNTVFGRVTPHQKRDIIKALQSKGHTVAMTGDGVNDVLALKEADCGIAMAAGSDAAKAVSQLVLLDSNFAALPEVVAEGRRMINNLERVAGLYLTKTIYSILLSFIFGIILLPYPFIPIQLTLISSIVIGIPSFFLALAPNKERVKKGFLYRVLSTTIPKGVVVTLFTLIIFLIAHSKQLPIRDIRTLTVIVAGGIGIMVLIKISKPLNFLRVLLIISMGITFALAFILPLGRSIFVFSKIGLAYLGIAILLVLISSPLINFLIRMFNSMFLGLKKHS